MEALRRNNTDATTDGSDGEREAVTDGSKLGTKFYLEHGKLIRPWRPKYWVNMMGENVGKL